MVESLSVRIRHRKARVERARKDYQNSVKERNALITAVKRYPNQKRAGHPIPKKEVDAAIAGWKKRVHADKAELDKQKERLKDLQRRQKQSKK